MDEKTNSKVMLMAFGLPVMTTAIVLGSMYAGHLITTRSDRPMNVNVSASTPRIDVNVPQAAPPTIAVNASAPKVDVHVPQQAAPAVTINPASMPAPHITVNPPPASVTVIREDKFDRQERYTERGNDRPSVQTVASAAPSGTLADVKPAVVTPPAQPAPVKPAEIKPLEPAKTESNKSSSATPAPVAPVAPVATTAAAPVSSPAAAGSYAPVAKFVAARAESKPAIKAEAEEASLDTLYTYATKYIDTYCKKRGLDPVAETRKWNKSWSANVEQAINDNIDSGEQSYINRQVIAKRDHFILESATPEKVVEACRILLRYRDGQLAWLQAMQDKMTKENLRKTVTFLAQGPH